MRFDDTNPTKEKMEFVESIKEGVAVAWRRIGKIICILLPIILIQMYECAVKLIKKGKAYVCDLTC